MGAITDEAARQISNLIGGGSPEQQIVASLLLAGGIIATSSVGLVGTLILVPVVLVGAFLGVLRLIPAVEDRWPL